MSARATADSRGMSPHPLRCRCGTLQGHVRVARTATRALCYCRDCQAYARFLGGDLLDGAGGTEVVATQPANVRFDAGLESLACLSLSPRGILRWYAQCCRTPIGNTPRDPRIAYVGLVQACLGDEPARRASFGPVRLAVNRSSARGHAAAAPRIHAAIALCNLGTSLLAARVSGRYRQTPFFDAASGEPVRKPHVLSPAERAQAYRDTA
jgi:hypothetical protein